MALKQRGYLKDKAELECQSQCQNKCINSSSYHELYSLMKKSPYKVIGFEAATIA